jgi:hypothetical protein
MRKLFLLILGLAPLLVSLAVVGWVGSARDLGRPLTSVVEAEPSSVGSNLATGDNVAGVSEEYARPTRKDIPLLTATKPAKDLFEKIRACFPDDEKESYNGWKHKRCYEQLVDTAAATYNPVDLINAVKALVADRPDLLSACHDGGHSAAAILTKRFWSSKDSYEKQLADMRVIMAAATDVCQNGYVHGFYDEVGKNQPNDDSFRAAGQVCVEMARYGLDCGHGLGHAAWNATKDFEKAATICALFESEFMYRCDDGVIMYIPDVAYRGIGPMNYDAMSPDFDAEKYYQDAVKICSWWPKERREQADSLRGCWIGIVSGVLWRPISELYKHYEYDEYLTRAQELLPYAEQACIDLGPVGVEYCINEWPGMVVFMVENEASRVEEFCSTMRKYRQLCIEGTRQQMRQNAMFDVEISRRDAADS